LKELLALQPDALRGGPVTEDALKKRRQSLYQHRKKLYGVTPHDIGQAVPKAVGRLELT